MLCFIYLNYLHFFVQTRTSSFYTHIKSDEKKQHAYIVYTLYYNIHTFSWS